jgi:hypothetical protein
MESPEQILVDDGRQLWEWQPGDAADETPVVRRRSGDGRQMIAEMFAPLKDAPADLKPHRAAEHDREIGGVRCRGYVITPPAARELSDEGKLVPARYSQRTIVWTDPQDRLVETEQQRQVEGQWQSGFRTSIRYDVEVPGEKFVAKLSAKAKIVSPDMSLDQRFPLAAALATKESDGLLFAIHEAERMEGGLIYIVSSVRGTPAYLKAHPPAHRRFNLTTTLLDVASVPNTARNMDADWNVAALASAELDGVYYSWWLAVPRVSYILKDGVEIPLDDPPDPKATEKAHLTLHAHPWALRDSRGHVPTVTATFDLSPPDKSTTLNQIAARVLADANDLTSHGVGVALSGGIDKNKMRSMPSRGVQVDHYVAEIRSQLAWCHKTDDVTDLNHSPPPR